jgi:hypothetical protein
MSDETQAGDILRGGGSILAYVRSLSSDEDWDMDDIYYAKRSGKLPIGNYGKDLISSKKKIARALNALVPLIILVIFL